MSEDERDLHGGNLTPPDWGRWLVNADKTGSPLGNPVRWGAGLPTNLEATLVQKFTDQFLYVQAQDIYSRSWAMVGELTLPAATWNAPGTFPAGPFPLVVSLEVMQGVGTVQVTQEIILMCGNSATAGLCNTQHASNGGPYMSRFSGVPGAPMESRPFSAIGAFIGAVLGVRARYVGGTNVGLPTTAQINAILTPFAPGGGL